MDDCKQATPPYRAHEHGDVGDAGAARAHGAERRVARGVQERQLAAAGQLHHEVAVQVKFEKGNFLTMISQLNCQFQGLKPGAFKLCVDCIPTCTAPTTNAPMCCVIPPASPAATEVLRSVSNSGV